MANGGYKGQSPARETSPEQYPGVWELTEQFQAQAEGNWPFQEDGSAPKSLMFNGSSSYLSTSLLEGNRRIWTWAAWVKRGALGSTQQLFVGGPDDADRLNIRFESDDRLGVDEYTSGATKFYIKTARVFRDPTAWMHLTVAFNSDDVQADRLKIYCNGKRVTDLNVTTAVPLSYQGRINSQATHFIGKHAPNSGQYYNGLMSEVHFIDGQDVSPEAFGFFDGQGLWMPKRFTGSYSSGPVFTNRVTGAHDTNHGWGTTYQTSHMFDGSLTTMTIGQANDTGLTFTPSSPLGANATTIRIYGMDDACPDSHLKINGINYGGLVNSGTGWTVLKGTGAVGSGISSIESIYLRDNSLGNQSYRFAALEIDGQILTDASVGKNSFRLDFSDGGKDQSGLGNDWGPSGIKLAESEAQFFQIKYSGTGNTNAITGSGFRPDFVWIKRMSSTNAAHSVYSSPQGTSKSFDFDNNTGEKTNDPQSFNSFDADGFTVSGTHNQLNSNGHNFAAFLWKAGGNNYTSHSASTAAEGSIASQYSAGDYFSIVKYSGTGTAGTVKHGMNKKPKWVVVTPIGQGDRRRVYHEHMDPTAPHNYYANLDLDQARTQSTAWNGAFTDKVITVGTDSNTNSGSRDYMAWCWAEHPSKSKFGVYDGSSSAVTVDCGFAPDWVIIKCVGTNGAGQEWIIKSKLYDDDEWLQAEQPYPLQSPGRNITWTANGFTVAPNNGPTNYNGRTLYIYSAFKTTSDEDDRAIDSCVNGKEASTGAGSERRGNYCCFNPLDKHNSLTVSNGNLKVQASTSQWELARSTFFLKTGKHYWEFTWTGSVTSSSGYQMGLKTPESTLSAAAAQAGSYAFQYTTIYQTNNTLNSVVISPGSITSGDTVMFAYDADAGKMWLGVNGTWNGSGNPSTGANPDWTGLPKTGLSPFAGCYGATNTITLNAGQTAFKYTNHSGFSPLATSFLPESSVKRGDEGAFPVLYKGNGAVKTVDGMRFSPDLVFLRNRADGYGLPTFDSQRGTGSTNAMRVDEPGHAGKNHVEPFANLTSFNDDGFTLGTTSNTNVVNDTGDNHVAFSFNAGNGPATTTAVGGLNSSAYNDSATWSNALSANPSNGLGNAANVFDGSESHTRNTNMNASATVTFTPSGTITNVTKLEVKAGAVNTSSTVFELNGVNKLTDYNTLVGTSSAVVDRYVDITSLLGGSTTLSSMKWGYNGSSNYNLIRNIKVNGAVLVDNGASVANVPAVAVTTKSSQELGFAISKWTGNGVDGARIYHGMPGADKGMIIVKNYSDTAQTPWWAVYHTGLSSNKNLGLNSDFAEFDETTLTLGIFEDVNNLSFKATAGGAGHKTANQSNGQHVCYAWAPREGYSAFGSFKGTGFSDNRAPFIYLGFKPRMIWIKSRTLPHDWVVFDSERGFQNPVDQITFLNQPLADAAVHAGDTNTGDLDFDILSNGFKLRTANHAVNKGSSDTYIYCAWAELPFASNSRAR